jgi:hypothetical protein
MKLPPLTTKQQYILKLLYKYRFLNRIQIQKLMGHKDKRLICIWLKDLREKHYVEWIYSTDFTERTKPGIYYLGLNGIRQLKTSGDYPVEELRKRYRESNRSEGFRFRCMLLADCCNDLWTNSSDELRYSFLTQADYADPGSEYNFLAAEDSIRPQLCYTEQREGGVVTTTFLLEVFDATLPQYKVRNRLKEYVEYLDDGDDWNSEREGEHLPTIQLVCPRVTDLIYAKRRTRKLIEDLWEPKDIHIQLTTFDKIKSAGVTGDIWENVTYTSD